jgi:hypothetical protein
MQLQHKLPVHHQLLVAGASMIASAAEQTLIPSAACFHIRDGDQRLRTHLCSVSLEDANPS